MVAIEDRLSALVLFGSLGLGLLLFGISIRLGKIKNWWLIKFNPIVPEAGAYIGIPLGIIFFILSLSVFFEDVDDRRRILDYLGILFISMVIIVMWRPRWLLPKWLRWLEDNHGDILPLLKREAQAVGGREWSKRVRTPEGLEAWVAEVRRKYGR